MIKEILLDALNLTNSKGNSIREEKDWHWENVGSERVRVSS